MINFYCEIFKETKLSIKIMIYRLSNVLVSGWFIVLIVPTHAMVTMVTNSKND